MKPRIPITTAALYWLLVLCGLVGTTILRRNHIEQIIPLWIGTVGGVTIGQLASKLRIRPLIPLLLIPGTAWIVLPFSFYFFAESGMSTSAAMLLALSFFPSLLGGYLSLSERGGIVAFWYPVVLWMIVILDHPLDARQTAFHPQAAFPFLVLLGALFVAFLRARETRRVLIWQGHGSPRLAIHSRRTVLRSSPVRSALSVVSTGAVGGVALLLTWWVAPQLWQKDHQYQREERVQAMNSANVASATDLPCCESRLTSTRIREYLPLTGATEESDLSCRSCATAQNVPTTEHGPLDGAPTYSGGGSSGNMETTADPQPDVTPSTVAVDDRTGLGYAPVASYVPPPVVVTPATPLVASHPVAAPLHPVGAIVTPPKHEPPKMPVLPTTRSGTDVPTTAPTSTALRGPGNVAPVAYVEAPRPLSSPFPSRAPWPWLFAAAIMGVLGHVLLRALRRTVTLAHLARPFWNEPVDQRISNHWQRMLIGLRDAGIQEGRDESPSAFARRIGIRGMESCATILERVRHGIRIEEHDLENMAAGASAVFTTARARAGLSGRAAAWLRWPLA